MTTRPGPSVPAEAEAAAAAIVAGSAAVLTILALDVAGPVRVVIVAIYLLLVPGLAMTRAAGFRSSVAVLSLAVVLSIGIDGFIGMGLYAVQRFEPVLATILVVAATLTLVLIERVVSAGRPLVSLDPPADPPGGAPTQR